MKFIKKKLYGGRLKQVKDNIMKVEGVSDVNLNLVWEPPWDKDKMSEAAKLELNL